MVSEDWLTELAGGYGLAPSQFVLGLPETQLSVIRWRRTQGNPQQIFTRDPIDSYLLSLHLQPTRANAWLGKQRVWSGPIAANTIRLTLPGARPRWVSDSSFDFLNFIFPRETIDRIAGAERHRVHHGLRKSAPLYCRDDIAASLGRSLLEALRRQRPFTLTFADAIGRALLAHLLGRYAGTAEGVAQHELSLEALRHVREYMEAHLNGDICVRDLAAVVGMSESHFAHGFRAATGIPPHRFLMTARLDRAQIRLGGTSRSMLDIALDCGFKDASHFSRVFKRFVGCTPKTFRREMSRSPAALKGESI